MYNDNMWLDENGIQLLEEKEIDEYFEKRGTTNDLLKSLLNNNKENKNIEKYSKNTSTIKDVFQDLIDEQNASDYNIGKLLDLRDSLQKKEEIQKNSFNKISQNFVFNSINPLRNSKLPVVPAGKSYDTYDSYNNSIPIIESKITNIIQKESLTTHKSKLLGCTGSECSNLKASILSAMCWKYLIMQTQGKGGS